jgi:hypothetical protein
MEPGEEVDWDPDDTSIIEGEWNQGALELLKRDLDYAQYKSERIFKFVHLFSGPKDVLKEALEQEAKKEGVRIEVASYDKLGANGHDLAADEPFLSIVGDSDNIDGYHSGYPCGSFSMVRSKEGGPPPVRSREWPYGLPSNDASQQREADTGTILAVRSAIIAAKVLDSQRRRKVGEVATLENPPGSETGPDLPSWELAELQEFLKQYEAQVANFNSCIHMEGKQRWWKPARWAGRLQGLEGLSGKCQCPSWVSHVTLLGKTRTAAAAEYPMTLAKKYAALVIKVFKQNLQLEFWRYKCQTKAMELSQLQKNWVKSREAKTPSPVTDNMQVVGSKRAWQAGDVAKDLGPSQQQASKKARKEKENDFFLGGMRNPDLAVRKMHMVRTVGADISRAWNYFLEEHPKALEIAENYGGGNCAPDPEVGEAWTKTLEKLLKAKEFDDVVMKEEFEFTSPLNAKLWDAWIRAAGDPECNVVDWIRRGVPLGMNCKIPTCGIFPETWEEDTVMGEAPPIDLMRDTRNYSSFYDLIEAAEEELGRYVQKGFAVIKDKEWITHRFGSGTVSKMALIQKTKDDGRVKNRVVVDLLRSGGNARAVVPERLVLPRVIDVLEAARRLNANSTEYIKAAKREGWMPDKEEDMYEWELVGADLQDAFCHFPVALQEVANCICPGVNQNQFVMYTALLFGFKAAPLLMARLSALMSRFLQSLFLRGEGVLQTYMDDPLFILAGPISRRNRTLALVLYSLYALGVNVAFAKGERGLRVNWIGVSFELDLPREHMKLTVSQHMVKELLVKMKDWEGAGMIGLKELRATTGKLSWVAGILPRMRWAVSIMYAVVASAERDAKTGAEEERAAKRAKDNRPKPDLVAVARFELPRAWLMKLLSQADNLLLRSEPLYPVMPDLAIVTDASPQGIGAVLCRVDVKQNQIFPWAALEIALRQELWKLGLCCWQCVSGRRG